MTSIPRQRVSAETALQALVASRALGEGPLDFVVLARLVAETFAVTSAVLARRESLRPLAVWSRGQAHEESEPLPSGGLLSGVYARGLYHYAEDADPLGPGWPRRLGQCGFLGMTLKSATGEVLGAIALSDDGPLQVGPSDLALLDVFALRAGAALERLRDQPLAERLEQARFLLVALRSELQNPLTGVRLNLEYLHREFARPDASALALSELREEVGRALECTERIGNIVRGFLTSYLQEDLGEK